MSEKRETVLAVHGNADGYCDRNTNYHGNAERNHPDSVEHQHGSADGHAASQSYTQFADTYQEANGLLYADRTPKFPIEEIRAATSQLMPTTTLMDPVLGREGAP